ncbi:2OG-Fe(II) oxygenase [Sphingomonas sp. RS2018]
MLDAEDLDQLLDAYANGDASAAMQLAVWSLAGIGVPQDFGKAREYLRRAVEIGHVDAALMETALTANGTGSPKNWRLASDRLHAAAEQDFVAERQAKLLAAMSLDDEGYPITPPRGMLLSHAPRITHFKGFLSRDECAHLATVGGALLEPAMVLDPASGHRIAHPIRICDEAAIGPAREDLVVQAINRRIARASETNTDAGEPLTILRYRPGGQYRPHVDAIAGSDNQRVRTMLLYLNGGFVGGETEFPDVSVTVKPNGGDALLFDNVLADGRPDVRTKHAGLPVANGTKWLATRWIRARPIDPWAVTA